MNVNSTHSGHEANLAGWSWTHDLIRGVGVIKAVGENHAPRLDSLSDDDHTACVWRLFFCNATVCTTDGHRGVTSRHALLKPLPNFPAPGETVVAMSLRQTCENSVPANLASSVSESLTQMCRGGHWWNSSEETPGHVSGQPVFFEVNTDYSTQGMEARKLTAVVNSWGAGAISQDTMLELLRKVKSSGMQEQRRRDKAAPANSPLLPVNALSTSNSSHP